jgi:hypothetical protein
LARRQRHRVEGLVAWLIAELSLSPLPSPTHRPQLSQLIGAVCDVGHQAEWALRQRLHESARDTEAEIGESHTEMLLEEAPEPRLVLRERHERAKLGRDGRRAQQLTEHASAQRDDVCPDSDPLPANWLNVAGMIGALVGETPIADVVCLLNALDDTEQVLG